MFSLARASPTFFPRQSWMEYFVIFVLLYVLPNTLFLYFIYLLCHSVCGDGGGPKNGLEPV